MNFDKLTSQEKARLFNRLAKGGYLKGASTRNIINTIERLYAGGGDFGDKRVSGRYSTIDDAPEEVQRQYYAETKKSIADRKVRDKALDEARRQADIDNRKKNLLFDSLLLDSGSDNDAGQYYARQKFLSSGVITPEQYANDVRSEGKIGALSAAAGLAAPYAAAAAPDAVPWIMEKAMPSALLNNIGLGALSPYADAAALSLWTTQGLREAGKSFSNLNSDNSALQNLNYGAQGTAQTALAALPLVSPLLRGGKNLLTRFKKSSKIKSLNDELEERMRGLYDELSHNINPDENAARTPEEREALPDGNHIPQVTEENQLPSTPDLVDLTDTLRAIDEMSNAEGVNDMPHTVPTGRSMETAQVSSVESSLENPSRRYSSIGDIMNMIADDAYPSLDYSILSDEALRYLSDYNPNANYFRPSDLDARMQQSEGARAELGKRVRTKSKKLIDFYTKTLNDLRSWVPSELFDPNDTANFEKLARPDYDALDISDSDLIELYDSTDPFQTDSDFQYINKGIDSNNPDFINLNNLHTLAWKALRHRASNMTIPAEYSSLSDMDNANTLLNYATIDNGQLQAYESAYRNTLRRLIINGEDIPDRYNYNNAALDAFNNHEISSGNRYYDQIVDDFEDTNKYSDLSTLLDNYAASVDARTGAYDNSFNSIMRDASGNWAPNPSIPAYKFSYSRSRAESAYVDLYENLIAKRAAELGIPYKKGILLHPEDPEFADIANAFRDAGAYDLPADIKHMSWFQVDQAGNPAEARARVAAQIKALIDGIPRGVAISEHNTSADSYRVMARGAERSPLGYGKNPGQTSIVTHKNRSGETIYDSGNDYHLNRVGFDASGNLKFDNPDSSLQSLVGSVTRDEAVQLYKDISVIHDPKKVEEFLANNPDKKDVFDRLSNVFRAMNDIDTRSVNSIFRKYNRNYSAGLDYAHTTDDIDFMDRFKWFLGGLKYGDSVAVKMDRPRISVAKHAFGGDLLSNEDSFDNAISSARKGKNGFFMWNGNIYRTNLVYPHNDN